MKLQVKKLCFAMLKAALFLSLIIFLCFFSLRQLAMQKFDDVWKQLGLPQKDAHVNINFSFTNGTLEYFGAKNAKNIAAGNRAALVQELVVYAKKYFESEEFKTFYTDIRKKMKPSAPAVLPVLTRDEVKAEERQRLKKQLKAAEEGLNSTNPKVKNGVPFLIESTKKQIVALDDPGNPAIKRRMDQASKMSNDVSMQYGAELHKFESRYPADAHLLLKTRLQQILDITSDVDYTAELKDGYRGKKVFVNPVYEKKTGEWKLAFRAGKTATDAVRDAAKQWLIELK
jgi:hypothetical protein